MLEHRPPVPDTRALQLGMNISLVIGFGMLAMKTTAYALTGSAAILSDAAESVVHVVAVAFASYSLRLAARPADERFPYGYSKIGYFSSGFEGALIILAALYIIYEAVRKWLAGLYLENLGLGTGMTALAVVINGVLGFYLIRLGEKHHSIILEADGKHVLTDSWTSLGVLIGLSLTLITGWLPWDPICALLVALNILFSGLGLIRRSIGGLMDTAEPAINLQLKEILDRETARHGIQYHDLRHRDLGGAHWVEVHLLYPGAMPLRRAHQIATCVEEEIEHRLEPTARVFTHLEAIEDHQTVHSDAGPTPGEGGDAPSSA
jgi:cation diffusion facilitator family transporter